MTAEVSRGGLHYQVVLVPHGDFVIARLDELNFQVCGKSRSVAIEASRRRAICVLAEYEGGDCLAPEPVEKELATIMLPGPVRPLVGRCHCRHLGLMEEGRVG